MANISEKYSKLREQGFAVVEDLFSDDLLHRMKSDYLKLAHEAETIRSQSNEVERIFYENNQENRSLYWKHENKLILQAGEGRYDLYKGFLEGCFAEEEIQKNSILHDLMTQLMVRDFTHYSGFIQSFPGSQAQYWHRDTHTLSNENTDGSQVIKIDDFYFTVLVPILSGFTVENGATEIMFGSHQLASHDFDQCDVKQVTVPLGGALVFNGKLNHRGSANQSEQERPALYMVFHKKWYNDQFRQGVDD